MCRDACLKLQEKVGLGIDKKQVAAGNRWLVALAGIATARAAAYCFRGTTSSTGSIGLDESIRPTAHADLVSHSSSRLKLESYLCLGHRAYRRILQWQYVEMHHAIPSDLLKGANDRQGAPKAGRPDYAFAEQLCRDS